MNKPGNINEKETLNSLENLSDEELVDLKNQAVADEDYDRAKEIKQEQERRKEIKEDEEKPGKEIEAPRTQEEVSQKREELKELLGSKEIKKLFNVLRTELGMDKTNFELFKVKESLTSLSKVNHELVKSNQELANRNKTLATSNENLQGMMKQFLDRFGMLVENLETFTNNLVQSNRDLVESNQGIKESIDYKLPGVVDELGSNIERLRGRIDMLLDK